LTHNNQARIDSMFPIYYCKPSCTYNSKRNTHTILGLDGLFPFWTGGPCLPLLFLALVRIALYPGLSKQSPTCKVALAREHFLAS